MRRFITILLIACACSIEFYAQTPYDSFAPETYRPMLGDAETESQTDTFLCAVIADLQNQTILLVDVSDGEIMAYAPITDEVLKWMSVDPLSDKYPGVSPYAYCGWNPINAIDPDGMDWYEADGEIKWTDYKSQEAMDKAKLAGRYLGEAVVIFDGNENECWGEDKTLTGENANPATVTIYGINGKDDIQTYQGMTLPQSDSYSTLNAGEYRLYYQDMATSPYGTKGALANDPPIAPALTYRITRLDGNAVLDGTKKGIKTTMTSIFMHRTNWDGKANHSSKGCMIIDGRQWRSVEIQLKKSSNIFLRVKR